MTKILGEGERVDSSKDQRNTLDMVYNCVALNILNAGHFSNGFSSDKYSP